MFEREQDGDLARSGHDRDQVSGHIDALREDIAGLKSDIAILRDDAMAAGKSGMRHVAGEMNEKLGKVASSARHAVGAAKSEIDHGAEKLREGVSSHPLSSIGLAIAAGFMLSKLLARR